MKDETKMAEEIIAKVIRENITNLDSEITPKELILICSKAMEEYANLRLTQQQDVNLEKHNSELVNTLKDIIFIAESLFNKSKPIKDTDLYSVTHPNIEEAKIVLSKHTT